MSIKDIYRFLSPGYQNVFLEYRVAQKPRYGHGKPPHPRLFEIIDSNRAVYADHLATALSYASRIQEIKKSRDEDDALAPVWNNGFLPGLDIIGLYTMVSALKPGRYVEIGSGYSTRVCHKAKTDQGYGTHITCIDPHPRAEIDRIAGRVIRQAAEDTDTGFILDLKENDILFIDNSHRIFPNSDSLVFFLEILPFLRKGVVVHVHDVYLPYDYPRFMCDRFYSEQYGLGMYLLADPQRYEPLLPNYFISEDPGLKEIIAPVWDHPNLEGVERHGGSFWLKIN